MAPSRVLVTGCGTGIGRAMAREFHDRGCVVLATDRRAAAIADFEQDGIATAEVDVTKPETLDTALNKFGAVDIVVCNAGILICQPLVEQPLSSIQSVIDTNVIGVMATVQAVAGGMMKRRAGTIVVIGSVSAAMITPYAGAYCASKAAVATMCEALQMELAPFDISVMHVITGSVQSNLSNVALSKVSVSAESLYAPIANKIEQRARMSQNTATAITADVYARCVCDASLSPRPPSTLLGGGMVVKAHYLGQWMPRSMLRNHMRATYGLSDLYAELHDGAQLPSSSSSWLARTMVLGAVAALAMSWVSHAHGWLGLVSS